MSTEQLETVNIVPDWKTVVRILSAVLQNPDADFKAKLEAEQELLRLAEVVDSLNEAARERKEVSERLKG